MKPSIWLCGTHRLEIGARALVMGIVNVTPDSFSDGGRFLSRDAALAHARQLIAEGADILDIGGESSRPGSDPVPVEEELNRVLPVVEALSRESDLPISVDTTKSEVARQCLQAGAAIINDITGLQGDPEMPGVIRETGAGVIVMHMQGEPKTMQRSPVYADVVAEVGEFFAERIDTLTRLGIAREQLTLDPGIGFGKTSEHNLQLLARLAEFQRFERPVCLGVSRKRFIGEILGREVTERQIGSVAVACDAIAHGAAQILRVHDVAPTRDAALIGEALAQRRG
jgi:dihydropteroate synthase